MTIKPEYTHGTSIGYRGLSCRCDYCLAWNRVRGRRGGNPTLMQEIAEAAKHGTPVPENATNQRRTAPKAPIAHVKKQTENAEEAARKAHQARLRAVQEANGSAAALALLAVAEATTDPLVELRYRRAGLALAEEAAHDE